MVKTTKNRDTSEVLKVQNIQCLLLPDNEKTVELLNDIYKVIERMNPNAKDLTAFTELLTAFKHSVGVSAFSYGLQMGLNISGEDETPDLKA